MDSDWENSSKPIILSYSSPSLMPSPISSVVTCTKVRPKTLSKRNLLTCGSDGNVRMWNGTEDDDPSVDSVSEMTIAVACSKDQFFVSTDSNYVQAFSYPERKRDRVIFRFSAPATHLSISPSGKFLAAGSCDMEIQVLNTETNKITTLTGHSAPVLGVSVDPLDEFLVSSSCDGSIKIWELATGSVIKTFHDILPKKNDFFKAICLGRTAWKSISGSLVAVPKDLEVVVFKRGTWEEMYRLKSDKIEKPLSVVLFSPCGNYVAAASTGGEIVIWEIKHKSEVCHYKEPKKAGISGMAWHPDGSEIAFSDRLGRLGVLTGINEEISKHVVPEEHKKKDENEVMNDEIDTNALFDDDDDDDDDDENCISLEKIKAPYKNESGDEEPPGSPGSSCTDKTTKEPVIPFTKPQPAFQPSSTPPHFEPRCLCYNSVGIVRYYDSDKTIDVQFHDTMFHHALFLRNFGTCTLAALSTNVLCLAVHSTDENPSKLSCIPLNSWAGSKEWTVFMSENEHVVGLAAGGTWVAVATSANLMRIFTHAGTQKQILSLPGPLVSMSGHEDKILVVCHTGIGLQENQNQGFILYQISNLHVRALNPLQPLPLYPKSVLKWIGFSDEGTPCAYDSEGLLRLLGHDSLHWEVACDFRNQRKSPSDHYFIIGLSEKYQNVRCVLCRNSFYPLIINVPTVLEIPLKLPLCALDTEKSIQEETFWRLMFSLRSLEKASADKAEYQGDVTGFEQTLKQTALKLFAEACRNSEDLRAYDVATFMSGHPLEVAVKYASKVGKMYLAEKLNGIDPVDWKNQHASSEDSVVRTVSHGSYDRAVYSQQDLFEDGPVTVEKENKPVESVAKNSEELDSPETLKISSVNPFKKAQPQKNEGPKGLKYFDSLMAKEAPKSSKSLFPNKPLKLKAASKESKEKKSEPKSKKVTFVQWFSTRKASLSEEYPNVSAGELTKLGMKLYKEEMSQSSSEGKSEEKTVFNFPEGKKRSSEEESESVLKRSKSDEEFSV